MIPFSPFPNAPIVYRLGHQVLILESGVRLPVGVPFYGVKALEMAQDFQVPQITSTKMRVDIWLASVSTFSRSRIKTLIAEGAIVCDGVAVTQASQSIKSGETYTVKLPEKPAAPVAQSIPLAVLYEDASIIVLNKQAGLVMHPGVGHADGTLVNALLAHFPGLASVGQKFRPGIVHRLDRETSGVLVVAKTDAALGGLIDAFKGADVMKLYRTIVHGVPVSPEGRVENLIGRHPVQRQRMAVVLRNGKPAITQYRLAEVFSQASLLDVSIETGRTHQIRVHMKQLGCPVVGDTVYGLADLDAALPLAPKRQMLHAWKIRFTHPATAQTMTFEAPLPDDFSAMLVALERGG